MLDSVHNKQAKLVHMKFMRWYIHNNFNMCHSHVKFTSHDMFFKFNFFYIYIEYIVNFNDKRH